MKSNRPSLPRSSDSLMLDGLSEEQQHRLIALLDEYMIGVDEGRSINIESLVEANGDLEKPLREYLEGLDWLGQYNRRLLPIGLNEVSTALPDVRLAPTFGDFTLGEELGRGAMGIVFAATKKSTGESMAIKLLAFGSSADANRIERFQREAAAAQSLCHPNIVKVYDVGSENGLHFYSMQRIHGFPLSKRIRIPGTDSVDYRQFANAFAEVAEALHTAHQAGIIHRDIKPSNLLMDDEHRLWITDFGLAHVEHNRQLTRTGDLVGTFQYMSPEQASGKPERIDPRTDIYSLGATLYEFFGGQPPFVGFSGAALLKQIQTSEPRRLKHFDPAIPRDLETIIRRAMRPDKNDRYATALVMSQDLRRFAANQPIVAGRVTPTERLARFTADHALGFVAGLAVCAVCTAALAWHGWLLSREQARTQQALIQSEHNYQNARRVIDTFGNEFADRLTVIPGTEAVRREVLAESLAFYQAFIDDANQDPRLTSDVAETRLKIARLISQAGSLEDAGKAYQEAITALENAAEAVPTSNAGLILHQALHESAMLESRRGEQAKARRLLLTASKRMGTFASESSRLQAESLLHNNLAIVEMRAGDRRAAVAEAKHAVEVLQRLRIDQSDLRSDSSLCSALADSLSNLSVMLAEAGDEANASAAAKAAVAIRSTFDAGSSSPDRLRRLALAYNNLAALDWRQGKTSEAVETYRRSTALLEQAGKKLPGQIEPQRELSVTLNNLGMALTSAKQDVEAERIFRRALAIACQTADADPKNAEAAQRTAGIWNNLGVLLRNRYDVVKARQAFEEAAAYQKRSCELVPQDRTGAKILEQIQSNLISLTAKERS